MPAWFYNLRLKSDSLYIGATKNLEKRYAEHYTGSAGRTSLLDPPVSLIYSNYQQVLDTAYRFTQSVIFMEKL